MSSRTQKTVELTHAERVMFPAAGYTKGDLFRFYENIAERLLPHLVDRPCTLERMPAGVTGDAAPHFWQKHTPDYYPAWIKRINLPAERGPDVQYVLVNDKPTLLYLVNQGTITFHPWLSRVKNLDRPDFVLFDFDPGESTFGDVIVLCKKLHDLLNDRDIPSHVKTSGKSGLHVLTPWQRTGGYDDARAFALEIARQLVDALPKLATLERSKAKRDGRVYVDVMQNARGHHVVPPYVARAVPGAAVSTPLQWKELTARLKPGKFDIKSIFNRLKKESTDPIAPLVEAWTSAHNKK